MITLSNRLEKIASLVPQGARLADIGSDHALLPSFLVQQGMISFAVAGEVNPGPFDAANRQVRDAGMSTAISVRRGDGLSVLAAGEVDAITIAGMGGSLIASILEAGKDKLEGVTTLVLQPNVGEDAVRRWLLQNGWFLCAEHILEEDGKIYEILVAVPAVDTEANMRLYAPQPLCSDLTVEKEMLLRLGPYLLQAASTVWVEKWESELAKMERIRQSLLRSDLAASRDKELQMAAEITHIREVLTCMQKEQP